MVYTVSIQWDFKANAMNKNIKMNSLKEANLTSAYHNKAISKTPESTTTPLCLVKLEVQK